MSRPVEVKMSPQAKRLLSAAFGLMKLQNKETVVMRDSRIPHIAKMESRDVPATITELRHSGLIEIAQGRRGVHFSLKPLATT